MAFVHLVTGRNRPGITPAGLIDAQDAIRPNDPVHDDPDPDRFYVQRRQAGEGWRLINR